MQTFRPFRIACPDISFFLPCKIIVLECRHDFFVDFICSCRLEFALCKQNAKLCFRRSHTPVMEIPERGIDVMTVTDQHNHRNIKQLAEFPERGRKNRGSSAERIACLGIDHGNIAVPDHLLQLTDQGDVIGEFSLADAADISKQLLSADEAVDGHNIICPVRKKGLCRDFEIHECVVIAKQQIGRLQILCAVSFYDCPVSDRRRHTQDPLQRLQIPFGADGRPLHIKPGELFFHIFRPFPFTEAILADCRQISKPVIFTNSCSSCS